MNNYRVYILECKDKSLYIGITTDVIRRLSEHNKGTASKYTRTRLPVKVFWYSPWTMDRSFASKIEYGIKQFSVKQKREVRNMPLTILLLLIKGEKI